MGFSHTKFLCYKAVLDYLVNVFLFSEWALATDVKVAHLLTDIWLMHALWMVIADVPMTR